MYFKPIVAVAFASTLTASVSAAQEQVETVTPAQVSEIATRLDGILTELQARNDDYPDFIAELEQGLVAIEQADERVLLLIAELTEATDNLEDGSDVDNAIDDYDAQLAELIAEAEGSNIEPIKATIPDLEATRVGLRQSDEQRARTVIEARNLIRVLEQDREAIAFFIRAGQVQRAAALLTDNIQQFSDLVADGRQVAASLMGTVNP